MWLLFLNDFIAINNNRINNNRRFMNFIAIIKITLKNMMLCLFLRVEIILIDITR